MESPIPGGGGELLYESDGDACRIIRINTLKETNLGVAPALFNPKGDHETQYNIDISWHTTLSDTCVGKNIGFPSSTP